eukprot:gene839-33570_t
MRDIGVNLGSIHTLPEPSHLSPWATFFLQTVAFIVFIMLVARSILAAYRNSVRKSDFHYVPFSADFTDVLITDCVHKGPAPTLTHHKTNRITTNHFDVDSFLSVWSYVNRDLAVQYEAVLKHMARIGDFREAFLSPEMVAAHGREDGLQNIRDAFTALKLVCWLNTLELKLFSAAYETKDAQQKMEYFLPTFGAVIFGFKALASGSDASFEETVPHIVLVIFGFKALASGSDASFEETIPHIVLVIFGFEALASGSDGSFVETVPRIGLAILTCPEPLHYYCLFSHTYGYDTVLMMYDNNRYEVESKYTQFVSLNSRPVYPRLDMTPLANLLNTLEQGQAKGLYWVANRFTDSGPILRLERSDTSMTKAQRYGHPSARPLIPSSIPPPVISAIVQSFMEYGMQGVKPKRGGFSWNELHNLNQSIPWATWTNTVLDQHDRGELSATFNIPQQVQEPPISPSKCSRRDSTSIDAIKLELAPSVPKLSEPSFILTNQDDLRALVNVLPPRFAHGSWNMVSH